MNMLKRMIATILFCALFVSGVSHENISVSAATKIKSGDYIGTYYMKGNYKEVTAEHGAYHITIGSIKNGYVKFCIDYAGRNYSPIYGTNIIKAKIVGNKASFTWSDGWENSGKGTLTFVKKRKVKLNVKEVVSGPANRATLDTNGTKVFLFQNSRHKLQ